MTAMPHHAVDADEEDYQAGSFNGRMPGAQPLRPDHQRELDRVLKDHAAAAWGELRGIDKLDAERAERVLAAAMGRLLTALKTGIPPKKNDRTAEFRAAAILLRKALMKTWGVPKKAGDANLQSQKTCRVCDQLKGFHKPSCEVHVAFEAARKLGILTN